MRRFLARLVDSGVILGLLFIPFLIYAKANPRVTITWAPKSYPTFCSNNLAPGGNRFRTVQMHVAVTGEPQMAKFRINDDPEQVWEPEDPANVHVLQYPAGEGRHVVEVWLSESGYHKRTFKVIDCGKVGL